MNDPETRASRRTLAALATLLVASLLAAGCDGGASATASPSPQEASTATRPDEVLATIDGTEITLADLAERIGARLEQMEFQYLSQRHDLIETTLEQYVRDQLLRAEAESRGIPIEELVAEVIGDQVNVTDDDVRFFYIQNQAQLGGRSFESIAPQIRDYLEAEIRDSALEEFAAELAAEREVEYRLDPFRVSIDTADDPVWGSPDAPITLIEFSDFECPYCRSFIPTLEQIKTTYADEVKVVFKQFPLRQIHPKAQKAAEASLCAHEQGMFWETHDLYFEEQGSLEVADLEEKAVRLGLDTEQFNACLSSGKYVDAIDADVADGVAVGVSGTPAIFVNGRPLPGGAVPFEMAAELIDDELERLRR